MWSIIASVNGSVAANSSNGRREGMSVGREMQSGPTSSLNESYFSGRSAMGHSPSVEWGEVLQSTACGTTLHDSPPGIVSYGGGEFFEWDDLAI